MSVTFYSAVQQNRILPEDVNTENTEGFDTSKTPLSLLIQPLHEFLPLCKVLPSTLWRWDQRTTKSLITLFEVGQQASKNDTEIRWFSRAFEFQQPCSSEAISAHLLDDCSKGSNSCAIPILFIPVRVVSNCYDTKVSSLGLEHT